MVAQLTLQVFEIGLDIASSKNGQATPLFNAVNGILTASKLLMSLTIKRNAINCVAKESPCKKTLLFTNFIGAKPLRSLQLELKGQKLTSPSVRNAGPVNTWNNGFELHLCYSHYAQPCLFHWRDSLHFFRQLNPAKHVSLFVG